MKPDNRSKSLLVKFYFHQRLLLMLIHYLIHKLSEEHILSLRMVIRDSSMDFVLFELLEFSSVALFWWLAACILRGQLSSTKVISRVPKLLIFWGCPLLSSLSIKFSIFTSLVSEKGYVPLFNRFVLLHHHNQVSEDFLDDQC